MIKTKSKIILKKIVKKDVEVIFYYKLYGKAKSYIKKDVMRISLGFSIENIPKSILVIPFISNILPICWTFDLLLYVDEVDEVFYKSLTYIKNAYRDMINKISFNGDIICNKVVLNKSDSTEKKLQLFSGGVDSLSTYINHKNEEIDFFYLWGSDIHYNNDEGFYKVKEFIDKIVNTENKNIYYIKSNFRDIILYDNINQIIEPLIDDNYWHAIQHGIALLGHASLVAYHTKDKIIYIPATFNNKYHKICASTPEIDEQFKFLDKEVVHDGYNYTRLDKVGNIVNYNKNHNNKFKMRVCWQSSDGNNCSVCEKCIRTMLELIAYGENPKEYNFKFNKHVKEHMKDIVLTSNFGGEFNHFYYEEIAKKLKTISKKNKEFNYIIEKYNDKI